MENVDIYAFSFESINGDTIHLSDYQNRAILIVNTASKCGFTKQYKDLEAIHQQFSPEGLLVLGVPSKDFGGQEFDDICDIKDFLQESYKPTFLVTRAYPVIGNEAHPFYQWANQRVGLLGKPKWNFHKYLIGKDGKLLSWFASTTKPTSKKMVAAIERALEG